jgi:hypothetical protein
VFFITRSLFDRESEIPPFISLLFFIHPANTQTVLCIDSFGEVLSTLLFLMALLFYIKKAANIITPKDANGICRLYSNTLPFVLCILIVGLGAFFVDINITPLLFFVLLDTLTNGLQQPPNRGIIILHALVSIETIQKPAHTVDSICVEVCIHLFLPFMFWLLCLVCRFRIFFIVGKSFTSSSRRFLFCYEAHIPAVWKAQSLRCFV